MGSEWAGSQCRNRYDKVSYTFVGITNMVHCKFYNERKIITYMTNILSFHISLVITMEGMAKEVRTETSFQMQSIVFLTCSTLNLHFVRNPHQLHLHMKQI